MSNILGSSSLPCDPQEGIMRDIHAVLREKQNALEQLRRELQALRSVTPLLSDAGRRERTNAAPSELGEALRTAAPLLVDETEDFDPEIRARLIDAAETESKLRRASKISRHLKHIASPFLGARAGR
jgi:hypothetical protein